MAMQKHYTFLVYPVFLAGALYVMMGCRKTTTGNTDPSPNTKKLVKIEEGTADYTIFEYGTDGALKKVKAVYYIGGNDQESYSWTLSYNTDKKLSQMISDKGTRIDLIYENGLLQKKENRDLNGRLNFVDSFYYENNRLLRLRVLMPKMVNNSTVMDAMSDIRFTYYSTHAMKEAFHLDRNAATGQLENSIMEKTETYDNKINPYSLLGDFGFVFFHNINTRNPVDEVTYDYRNGDYYIAKTITNDYMYDAAGYVLVNRQTITLPGQQPRTITYRYTYQ